jgi:FMN phosphatase YigB (HAD superfamily)
LTKSRPDLVALDLDGTMYSYEPCHKSASLAVTEQVKNRLGINKTEWLAVYQQAKKEVKGRLGNLAASHSRLHYFKLSLEKLGLASHLDFAYQLETTYWGNFIREIKKVEGLDQFLEVTREHAIPVIVMTDLTTSIQIRKLHHLGVLEFVTGLITSEEVGGDKPNPEFVSYAQSNFGVAEGHWWVIGDDPVKDQGLALSVPSGEFINLSTRGGGRSTFLQLASTLERLCKE